jgi:anti-sigma factor RsiW
MPLSEQERENLVAYLDGELDEESTQALEAKLNLDAEARAEAEAMKRTWGLLHYLPRPEPAADFTHRTLEKLALKKPIETGLMPRVTSRGWLGAGWAAAILLAAGLGWWGAGLLTKPSPVSSEDEQLVRHLRVIQKLPLYEQVDDIEFLRALDHPDLFGEEAGS